MQLASGLASFFIFCPLERLSAIPADHIDLTRRPDDEKLYVYVSQDEELAAFTDFFMNRFATR